ncbi:hypothetical protein H5410_002634, partial [Solanum commersonii]
KNHDGSNSYDPTTTIINQFKTNRRDEQDRYNYPPPTTNQDLLNLFNQLATTRITHQFQISGGQTDPYDLSHIFYLKTPRSLIAPALSFPHIIGEKIIVEKEYDIRHHFQKKKIGKFSTVFYLPEDARVDKVISTMENEVLIVTIPKKGAVKKSHRLLEKKQWCRCQLESPAWKSDTSSTPLANPLVMTSICIERAGPIISLPKKLKHSRNASEVVIKEASRNSFVLVPNEPAAPRQLWDPDSSIEIYPEDGDREGFAVSDIEGKPKRLRSFLWEAESYVESKYHTVNN